MNNPFADPDYQFSFDISSVGLSVSSRSGNDVAVVLNSETDEHLIFERMNDGSEEGFTWWCVGRADEAGNVVEVYDPAPMANEVPQVMAIEAALKSVPEGVRMLAHLTMDPRQN